MPRYAMVVVADAANAEDAHELLAERVTGPKTEPWQPHYVGDPFDVPGSHFPDEYATVGIILTINEELHSLTERSS